MISLSLSSAFLPRCLLLRRGWHGVGPQPGRTPGSLWDWHAENAEGEVGGVAQSGREV